MPEYSFFVWNKRSRVRYPKSFYLHDVEAAYQIATKIAQVFVEVVPYWEDLSSRQRDDFVVEIRDVTGQTVLTVPFSEAEELSRDGTERVFASSSGSCPARLPRHGEGDQGRTGSERR
jgi:hypothetical protein